MQHRCPSADMLAIHPKIAPNQIPVAAALAQVQWLDRVRNEAAANQDDGRADSRIRRLQNAREVLRARYFEAITMHDLAAAACMSLHHFMRCYSAAFGRSAHDELIALRVGLAEHLLTTTKLKVRQIAGAVGFESRTTLFRHFIRHHGCSPDEFRREQVRLDRILRCDAAPWLLLKRRRGDSGLEPVREQGAGVDFERT
jgi:transcriptional regulator GlxA family with amidase domain